MNRRTIRGDILLRSVQRLLDPDERVTGAVMMSTRHRWFVPYAIASGIAIYAVTSLSGIQDPLNRIVLVGCGVALAGISTTNYMVLANTSSGLVMFRSSRVRQYAKELLRRLPADTRLEMVGSTVITSDWRVEGVVYTMTKRWEATMRQLASMQ